VILLAKIEKTQKRIASALFIMMTCAVPLYIDHLGYFHLTWRKYNFFTVCMFIIITAAAIVFYRRYKAEVSFKRQKKFIFPEYALLGFVFITLLSSVLSPVKTMSEIFNGIVNRHDGLFTQMCYVLVFFIMAYWYKPNTRDFGIFGITAIIISLIGILQFYGMDIFRLWPQETRGWFVPVDNFYNVFARSTIGNINFMSTYLCIAILLCGFLYVKVESKWRPVWLGASGISFWFLLMTSNSGQLGTLAGIVLAVPFIMQSKESIARFIILASTWVGAFAFQRFFYNFLILETEPIGRLILYVAITALLLSAGLFLLLFVKGNRQFSWKTGVVLLTVIIVAGFAGVEIIGRHMNEYNAIYEARELMHGRIHDDFGTNRVYIWRNALTVVPDNPLIGTGPDTFLAVFPEEAQMHYGALYDKAHNEYLQILVCQGILGLLCYLLFIGSVLFKSTKPAFSNPMLMALMAAFTGYIVQAFFNISLPLASQILWVMAGIMVGFLRSSSAIADTNLPGQES